MRMCLLFILGALVSSQSIGSIDKEQAMKAVVMIDSSDQSGRKREFGAGLIVGSDSNWIYIATAAHVVHGGKASDIQIKFRQLVGEKKSASVIASTVDEDFDFAVLKVASDKQISMPRIGRLYQGETPSKLQFVGRTSNDRHWSSSPLFKATPISDEDFGDHVFAGAFPLMPLKGFSGGGVFDAEWRLAGMHLADNVVDEDSGNALAKYLKLSWLRSRLEQISIPMALYLQDIEEGPMPLEYQNGATPILMPTISNHKVGAILQLSTISVRRYLEDVSIYIFLNDGSQWREHERLTKNIAPAQATGINKYMIPANTQGIHICASNEQG